MKMKYNFGLIKGLNVGFKVEVDGKQISFFNTLKDVKKTKDSIKFIFEKLIFEVNEIKFINLKIERKDNVVWFIQQDNPKLISGLVGFSMFDTMGFPMEITSEILSEQGFELDLKGCNVMLELQKEKSKNTFKSNSAF